MFSSWKIRNFTSLVPVKQPDDIVTELISHWDTEHKPEYIKVWIYSEHSKHPCLTRSFLLSNGDKSIRKIKELKSDDNTILIKSHLKLALQCKDITKKLKWHDGVSYTLEIADFNFDIMERRSANRRVHYLVTIDEESDSDYFDPSSDEDD